MMLNLVGVAEPEPAFDPVEEAETASASILNENSKKVDEKDKISTDEHFQGTYSSLNQNQRNSWKTGHKKGGCCRKLHTFWCILVFINLFAYFYYQRK